MAPEYNQARVAAIVGISSRTIIRWRRQNGGCDQRNGPAAAPANKLSEQEKEQILAISNSTTFRDMSPKQIVPKLADQGVYIASESSFYRVLKDNQMVKHRERSKPAKRHRPKEHMASDPCQVWQIFLGTKCFEPAKVSQALTRTIFMVYSQCIKGLKIEGRNTIYSIT